MPKDLKKSKFLEQNQSPKVLKGPTKPKGVKKLNGLGNWKNLKEFKNMERWSQVPLKSRNRKQLKDLLSKDVYDGFVAAIGEREQRGEVVESTFVSIDKAELNEAALKAKQAMMTIRFVSKIITVTRNASGAVIDGAADKIVDVTDIWTFSRDTTSRDPNWRLVATEAGQ